MSVDLKETGTNVFDLAVDVPVVEKWPIFRPENMFSLKDIEQIAGEINSVANKVMEAYKYILFFTTLFPESKQMLDNSPDLGVYFAAICANYYRNTKSFPNETIALKILFPDLFSEHKKSMAGSALFMWDKTWQYALEKCTTGGISYYKILFPERHKDNIQLPKPDKIIERIKNKINDDIDSKILWLAEVRIVYPEVEPQDLVDRNYLEKKYREFIHYKNSHDNLRGSLYLVYALAILTAEKVEVDESGLKITMPQMQTSITERTILPEERSF